MRRRLLLVLTLVLLVGLAGCLGNELPGEEDRDILGDVEEPDDGDGADNESIDDEPVDEDGDDPPYVSGYLEVHHIDAGQADSTLIISPEGETILIDTGDWRQGGDEVIAYLEEQGIDRIDHLIATHAHADHIGGHNGIIEWAETEGGGIGAAYDSGVPSDSATYDRYLDAIEEYEVDLFTVEEGDELPIEDENVSAVILNPPEGNSGGELHHNSIAIALEFGDFRYITTGDAEGSTEERLIADWLDELDADLYQAGHHGSSTSSTRGFLDELSPEMAVISSGYDSQYGHPHDETLERFAEYDIETYWTGVHGNIVITTDGSDIDVETSEDFSSDPADLLDEKPNDETSLIEPISLGAGALAPA